MTSAPSGVLALGSDQLVIPPDLPAPSPGSGEVVLLLADAEAAGNGWGVRAGCEVARHWARSGMRVILADGDLAGAPLHGTAGIENEEGVSDLLLYGSSPYRVARRVEGEDFLLITAGTIVADPAAVYRHGRWPGILSAFRESGCVLLVYLPDGFPGVESLLSEGDRVLRLNARVPAGSPEPGVHVLVPEVHAAHTGSEVEVDSSVRDGQKDRTDRLEEGMEEVAVDPPTDDLEIIDIRVDDDHSKAALLEAVEEVEREAREAAARRATTETTSDLPVITDLTVPVAEEEASPPASVVTSPAPPRPVASRKFPWIVLGVLLVVSVLLLLGWLGYLPLPGISYLDSGGSPSGTPFPLFDRFSALG